MNNTISLIVPVYGVELYVGDCLKSIINQTYNTNVECIIIDDCTTDNSMDIVYDIIDHYDGEIQFNVIVHDRNKGLSGARNTGLSAAKGDYVMFVDSDDILAPNCIESLIKPLSQRQYDMVVGDFEVFGGEDVFLHLRTGECEFLENEPIADAVKKNRLYSTAWGKIYNSSFLKNNELSFCEGIIHEDELFSSELYCVINSTYCTPDICYYYRVRNDSIMTSIKFKRRQLSCEIILDEMYSFLKKNNLDHKPTCNDLLYRLFSFANEISWKYSTEEYNKTYEKYRKLVDRHYGERFFANNRFRSFIRDSHFLFPPRIGRFILKKLIFS